MIRRNAKYLHVANELAAQIQEGAFGLNEKLYSRSQICERYQISPMTAARVQDHLADLGLVRKVRGSGLYINFVKKRPIARSDRPQEWRIGKIIECRISGASLLIKSFCKGVERAVEKNGIHHVTSYQEKASLSASEMNAIEIDGDAGYIAYSDGFFMRAGMVLLNPAVPSVLLDNVIPGSHCVLVDNFDGMKRLIDYAQRRECRRIIFAGEFPMIVGSNYRSERLCVTRTICSERGLPFEVFHGADANALCHRLRHTAEKTAVLFPQDDAALRFVRIASGEEAGDHLVLGFDDYAPTESGLAKLTTYRVDRAAMGAEAVRLLLEPQTASSHKKISRVRGTLRVAE